MKRTTAILISTIVTALLVVTVLAVSAAKSDTGIAQAASQLTTPATATDANVDLATQPQQFDQSFTFDQHEQFEHEHDGGEHSQRNAFGGFGDD